MQARTRVSSRVSLGLAGQLCITHVGYYRAGPVPVIRRGLVEQEFAWRARWPRGSVPCRRAVGRGGRCLLYTSDAADDLLCVDLGGRRIIKKKKKEKQHHTTTTSKI